jgi:hypothetical protein
MGQKIGCDETEMPSHSPGGKAMPSLQKSNSRLSPLPIGGRQPLTPGGAVDIESGSPNMEDLPPNTGKEISPKRMSLGQILKVGSDIEVPKKLNLNLVGKLGSETKIRSMNEFKIYRRPSSLLNKDLDVSLDSISSDVRGLSPVPVRARKGALRRKSMGDDVKSTNELPCTSIDAAEFPRKGPLRRKSMGDDVKSTDELLCTSIDTVQSTNELLCTSINTSIDTVDLIQSIDSLDSMKSNFVVLPPESISESVKRRWSMGLKVHSDEVVVPRHSPEGKNISTPLFQKSRLSPLRSEASPVRPSLATGSLDVDIESDIESGHSPFRPQTSFVSPSKKRRASGP